jgi:hypothetical protein
MDDGVGCREAEVLDGSHRKIPLVPSPPAQFHSTSTLAFWVLTLALFCDTFLWSKVFLSSKHRFSWDRTHFLITCLFFR